MLLAVKVLLVFVIAYSVLILIVGGLEPWVIQGLSMNICSIGILVLVLMQDRNMKKDLAKFVKETNESMDKFVEETNEIMEKY